MVPRILSQTNRNLAASVHNFFPWRVLAYWIPMSRRDDIEKLWKREDLSIRGKFDAYLEGYMMAFDPYPVCKRQLYAKNDLYALLRDFFVIGEDMNKAAQKLLSASDSEFSEPGVGPDEIRRRRIEAAKRTLAAIERTRAKIAGSSE
jgi:hypothetical protein